MAHLWFDNSGTWTAFEIAGSLVDIACGTPRTLDDSSRVATANALVVILASNSRAWLVLAGSRVAVRVNGMPIAGLRALHDRDEIRIEAAGRTLFFSTEKLAGIEPFNGATRVFCPRCRQEILQTTPSVRCPQCGVWHHEDGADLLCWTYAERCALCPQPTALGSQYQWIPEAL